MSCFGRTIAIVAGIVLCAPSILHAQPAWQRQLPLPQGQTLNDVVLVNANTAVAVGVAGTVVRTTDGGNTWEAITRVNGIDETLHTIEVAGARLYALGDNHIFLRSDDGGATWVAHTNPSTNSPDGISFVDALTGYLVAGTEVFRTDTGGISWMYRPLPAPLDVSWYRRVDMASSQTIMLAGGRTAITHNDGLTWTDLSSQINVAYDCEFLDPDTVVVGGSEVWLSTDGGVTFDQINSPVNGIYVNHCVAGILPARIFTGARYSPLYQRVYGSLTVGLLGMTANEGVNWSMKGLSAGVNGIDAIAGSTAVSVGLGGQIQWSTDGGVSWAHAAGNPNYSRNVGQAFHSMETGIVFDEYGFIEYEPRTEIWRTSDGGATWAHTWVYHNLFDIAYLNETTLYAVGMRHELSLPGGAGVVRMSIDGGANWSTIFTFIIDDGGPPTLASYRGVDICPTGDGIVVGESEYLASPGFDGEVLTIDGSSVTRQPNPGTGRLNAVSMFDCDNAIAVGDDGTIIVTTDGGLSWTPSASGTPEHLLAVQYVGQTRIYAAGENGTFLVSADGGVTWSPRSVGTAESIHDLSFNGAINGIVVAGQDVYSTSDGAVSWSADPVTTGGTLTACSFFGPGDMTVSTSNKLEIFARRTVTAVDPPGRPLASHPPTLEPSFPNPFNPATTIRYSLPERARVQLRVYSTAGALVAILASGELPAGVHEARWNGRDRHGRRVASGVYFYRLEALDQTLTHKMLLLK